MGAPDDQRRGGDPVGLPPRLLDRRATRDGCGRPVGGGAPDRLLVAVADQFGGDQRPVVHHQPQVRRHPLRRGALAGVVAADRFLPLRRHGGEQRQPAGAGDQHQPVHPVGVVDGELHRHRAAGGHPDHIGPFDAQLGQHPREQGGQPGVPAALGLVRVGAAVARQVDDQHPVVGGQGVKVLPEVAPAVRPRGAAVDAQQDRAGAGLVVVDPGRADADEA
ncbi:hypothetical protein SDC9_130328 [bioreactor metagenome]|uniref:Uncharacterized protein n=1 Tax=bioreactor metagenome TaxID=1076179 RepID=A0A645D265_9ZZZZ